MKKAVSVLLALVLALGLLALAPVAASAADIATPMIAAKYYHSLALKSDGTVWAWGQNTYGQVGDGTTTNKRTPVQVSGLNGVTAVAAGEYHSLALKSDGTVWAWGENGHGQLGDGTTTDSGAPVQVKGAGGAGSLSGVAVIASGGHGHSLALKSDGTVWAWGYNYAGQLGDGTTTDSSTPVQVLGAGGEGFLSGVTAISTGRGHSLALKNDGTVWAWGYNVYGQLGDGTAGLSTNKGLPVQVMASADVPLSGVTAIGGGYMYSLALKSDGTVWAWGWNHQGELGDGTADSYKTSPVQVSGPGGTGFLSGVTAIAAGYSNSLALKSDGTVWAWGYNYAGQLGDGTNTNKNSPVQVLGPGGAGHLSGVTAVAAGYNSLALKSDGTVWAWGDNGFGELGDGTTSNRTTPVQVKGAGGAGWLNLHAAGPAAYTLTVVNGTGSGSYEAGAVVPITADAAPEGQVFDKWTATGGGTFADANSASTTFAMPANAATVTAAYKGGGTPPPPEKGIFGTNPRWTGAWWHYVLFFVGFGFLWMWF